MSDIDFLGLSLSGAVHLRLAELRAHPVSGSEMARRFAYASLMISTHGDSLMFPDRHTAATFNALADALACAIALGHDIPGPLGTYLPQPDHRRDDNPA